MSVPSKAPKRGGPALLCGSIALLLCLPLLRLHAEFIAEDVNEGNRTQSWIVLPYAFSSDTTGFTAGAVGIWNGYGQRQMTWIATAFAGAEQQVERVTLNAQTPAVARASGAILAINNYRPGFLNRLFISLFGSYGYYPNQKLYIDGANDSDADDVLETQGYNNWFYFSFRYVLPLGEGADDPVTTYRLDRGLPVNRGGYGGGLPFVTGRTIVELRPTFNRWTVDKLVEEPQWTTVNVKLRLEHDNTDYIDNPSRGYGFALQYADDPGLGDSTQSWNALEASFTQYISLPLPSWQRFNVIALNAWSAWSPSWDADESLGAGNDGLIAAHRPPPWEGARLGGWERLRGYPSNRYNDKAAVYYGAEYRFIPDFNPLRGKKWMPFAIDWFEGVVFAETGRVAPRYDPATLHSHMKFDVGFSLRALAAKVPLRFDIASGSEGINMWVMVGQTF